MQSAEAIKRIKEQLNLVDIASRYVDLKRNGSRFVAPCPFHQETRPSFSVDPDRGLFYCFGCQASGDIFDFYGKINGLDFRETLEQLAQEAGIHLDLNEKPGKGSRASAPSPKKAMLYMHEIAARHFQAQLQKDIGAECRQYIEKRGLDPAIVDRFGLGWAPRAWHSLTASFQKLGCDLELACSCGLAGKSDRGGYYDRFRGRLMFPIKNLSNQIIAFGGRIIGSEDEAKYINSADTPIYSKKDHLFGLAQARRSITAKDVAILTEGYMDVLTLHQYGFENSVGVLGTALTPEQVKRLSGFTSRLMLVFDGDSAGRKAALRSSRMFLSVGLACNVAILPDGEDIDSFLRASGRDAFEDLMLHAPDGLAFCVSTLRRQAPRQILEWARQFLASITMPELVSGYASALALQLGIDEKSLRAGMQLRNDSTPAPAASRRELNMRDKQIMVFAVRYPERLEDLRALGADMALSSPRARAFWELIEEWGPEEVVYHLDDRQKTFWLGQRGPAAPPLTTGDAELACLERALAAYYDSTQKTSLFAALADQNRGGDFETALECLRALQETMEKRREQS